MKNTKIFLSVLIVIWMISLLLEGIIPDGILSIVRIIQYAIGVVLLSTIWRWKDVPPVVIFSFGYNDEDDNDEDGSDEDE